MHTDTYHIDELESVALGRQGENGARRAQIDVSDWISELGSDTEFWISAVRPGEDSLYVPSRFDADAGVLTWTFDDVDTARCGWGRAEIRAIVDGALKKSATFTTRIEPSLMGTGVTPDPVAPDWAAAYASDSETLLDALKDLLRGDSSLKLDPLQVGGFNPSTGANSGGYQNNSHYCKTGYRTQYTKATLFTLPAGTYEYTIFLYSNSTVSSALRSLSGGKYVTGSTLIPPRVGNQTVRIAIRRADGAEITAEERAQGGPIDSAGTFSDLTDESLSIAGAAADAKKVGDLIGLLISKNIITRTEWEAL